MEGGVFKSTNSKLDVIREKQVVSGLMVWVAEDIKTAGGFLL